MRECLEWRLNYPLRFSSASSPDHFVSFLERRGAVREWGAREEDKLQRRSSLKSSFIAGLACAEGCLLVDIIVKQ